MLERDGYIPGVPCWVDTRQPDPAAAADFYGGLFGWDVEETVPPDAPGTYLVARLRGGDVAAVGAIPDGAPQVATWNTYIWVDDADATASKVFDAGGRVVTEPFDVGDAGRMAVCADPEGALFCLWQAGQHKGAQIVNEPGSVNFNTLVTRDLEAARKFYGAVFGWETLDIGGGVPMWALTGYGDHLESRDPGMRARMAEMGAPRRFEDVVAGIDRIPADDADTPAHWGVTFAVEDADATARRAAELGAKVT